MMRTTTIACATALALFSGPVALAGNGVPPKAGGPQGGLQPTTAEGSAMTKSGGAAAAGGTTTSGAMKRGQATTAPEPSSKGGK